MKRIPISAAKRVADSYDYDQIVILGRKVGDDGGEHIATYGVNPTHCDVAAMMGRKLKDICGWPDSDLRDRVLRLLKEITEFQYGDAYLYPQVERLIEEMKK